MSDFGKPENYSKDITIKLHAFLKSFILKLFQKPISFNCGEEPHFFTK